MGARSVSARGGRNGDRHSERQLLFVLYVTSGEPPRVTPDCLLEFDQELNEYSASLVYKERLVESHETTFF